MGQRVKFRIFRFDPERDSVGRLQDYHLEVEEGATILNCLNRIRWEQDMTLAARFSCGSAICGSCAMRVNGHATLICKTQLSDRLIDGQIEIRPLGNMKVVKDLVVQIDPFFKAIGAVDPLLRPDPAESHERERLQSQSDFLKIEPATTCILCAACFSDCQVRAIDDSFIGPAALTKANRFIFDTRDSTKATRLRAIMGAAGAWDCVHCAECSTRCPTEASPLERIMEIKTELMSAGLTNTNGARHALAFRETVGKRGLLDENYTPVRSIGFFNIPGLLSLVGVGFRMLIRGKAPPFIPHSIEKAEEVRAIYARSDQIRAKGAKGEK